MSKRRLADSQAVVMGLGRFGGGLGAVRWLAEQGARVVATDLSSAASLAEQIERIQDLINDDAVTLRLGRHETRDFTSADLVVASPAVGKPWTNPYLLAAAQAGAEITTEIRLLAECLPDRRRVIGVTGTAGKSTTAAMIARALRETRHSGAENTESGKRGANAHSHHARDERSESRERGEHTDSPRVYLGGNIGGSLLLSLDSIDADDWVALELSSFMLYWLGQGGLIEDRCAGWAPGVSVITNFSPNHLDWHGSVEHYQRCKRFILEGQRPGDVTVMDDSLRDWRRGEHRGEARLVGDRDVDRLGPVRVIGAHNRRNAALAAAAVEALGADADSAREAVRSFEGLPHRLEVVVERDDVRAVNDSKSTTPQAAAAAVAAFDEPGEVGAAGVRLICGGFDKGSDLSPLAEAAARCAGVYTIGATGSALTQAVRARGGRAVECGELPEAVRRAATDLQPGQVMLLSPGCASWDQFENFERRGEAFTTLARSLFGERSSSAAG